MSVKIVDEVKFISIKVFQLIHEDKNQNTAILQPLMNLGIECKQLLISPKERQPNIIYNLLEELTSPMKNSSRSIKASQGEPALRLWLDQLGKELYAQGT